MNIYYLVPTKTMKSMMDTIRGAVEKLVKRVIFSEEIRGDTQIIFQHCDLLRKNGYNAQVIHLGPEPCIDPNWFFHYSSLKHYESEDIAQIKSDDIVICPDTSPELVLNFVRGRRLLFVQNWAKYHKGTAEKYGYEGIITVSQFCKEYLSSVTNLPVYPVQNGIELKHFNYSTGMKKSDEVLILYRKNRELIDTFIEEMPDELRRYFKFRVVHKRVDKSELISLYKESDMFLNFGYPEGFGLMPLEAMACGCVVGGYTGKGASGHMIDGETALVVEDGKVEGMYQLLYRIMNNPSIKDDLRRKGIDKAKEFSLGNMEISLLQTFNKIVKKV